MTDAGEIIKSGAGEKIADLVNKLAGPLAEEVGMIFGDTVRVYRVKNWIKTLQKTERLLRDSGLPANPVPPGLFLPIMEASSIEDNETLQEMWAGLLATASQKTDSVSPAFIETLKQLTPGDARHLEVICQESLGFFKQERVTDGMELVLWAFGDSKHAFASDAPEEFNVPPGVYPDTYVRLGLIRSNYEVHSHFDGYEAKVTSDVDGWYEFTGYAVRFLDACHGPCPCSK
ncbi:MAG: Abi-alpha family protein [Silvibacterium sp.]